MAEQSCENCKFWCHPDPTGKIGNQGMCSALARRGYNAKSNPVGPEIKAPFWTKDLTRLTTSWEGKGCPTYKQRPGTEVDGKPSGRAL